MKNVHGLSRREFLKLTSLIPAGIYYRPPAHLPRSFSSTDAKNIILIVFDAWSQRHVSLYGYRRETMPNLERFAARFTVYHNHYSTGTFTVPGTSSLLTGMYPWTHRAFQLGGGLLDAHAGHTIFSVLASTHSTLAFTQNKYADQILAQADPDLDHHLQYWSFNLQKTNPYGNPVFQKDPRIVFASMEDNFIQHGKGLNTSPFLGLLYRLYLLYDRRRRSAPYEAEYPRGLPDSPELFLLPDVVDGAIQLLKGIQQPGLAYLHFYPPHEPYNPTREFFGKFSDGWLPPAKDIHALSEKKVPAAKLSEHRQYYDEFLANWDAEVVRLFDFLHDSGLMENSYIFLTSDHGDLFERGELGHWTKTIHDPVIHVPLLVHAPGQTAREDVHAMTCSVDLLPTIAHLTGNPIPAWNEGVLLPGLGGTVDEKRSFFAMDAKYNSSFGPLVKFSMSLTRDDHRLVYYYYPTDEYKKFEFYNIQEDVEEMNDLYPRKPALALKMQDELLQKVEDVNRPFRRDND